MTDNERFTIYRAGRMILSSRVVSNRLIRPLSEAEVASLAAESDVRFFVNSERDDLHEVASEAIASFWQDTLRDHIADGDDSSLNEFENGYKFRAELWKGHGGQKIVVFFYHH